MKKEGFKTFCYKFCVQSFTDQNRYDPGDMKTECWRRRCRSHASRGFDITALRTHTMLFPNPDLGFRLIPDSSWQSWSRIGSYENTNFSGVFFWGGFEKKLPIFCSCTRVSTERRISSVKVRISIYIDQLDAPYFTSSNIEEYK